MTKVKMKKFKVAVEGGGDKAETVEAASWSEAARATALRLGKGKIFAVDSRFFKSGKGGVAYQISARAAALELELNASVRR